MLILPDFTKWEGPFVNGKRHGVGRFYDIDGKIYIEKYSGNELVDRKSLENQKIDSNMSDSDKSNESVNEFIKDMKEMTEDTQIPKVKEWDLNMVCKFLVYLRMDLYAEIFRENKIEGSALISMKESDLTSLGITTKGHRMVIREGIEKLRRMVKEKDRNKIPMHKYFRRLTKQNTFCHSMTSTKKLKLYYKNVNLIEEEDADSKSSAHGLSQKSDGMEKQFKSLTDIKRSNSASEELSDDSNQNDSKNPSIPLIKVHSALNMDKQPLDNNSNHNISDFNGKRKMAVRGEESQSPTLRPKEKKEGPKNGKDSQNLSPGPVKSIEEPENNNSEAMAEESVRPQKTQSESSVKRQMTTVLHQGVR